MQMATRMNKSGLTGIVYRAWMTNGIWIVPKYTSQTTRGRLLAIKRRSLKNAHGMVMMDRRKMKNVSRNG